MRVDRRWVRYFGAGLAAVMAAIYFLIGARVLDVGAAGEDADFLIVFGALAGGAFLLGAVLLVATDRRWLWIVGAVFQVFVIWAYIDVSKQRTPPFELWGITLRVIQLPLLACLAYLALRPSAAAAGTARRRDEPRPL
jgi:hypothetical protein